MKMEFANILRKMKTIDDIIDLYIGFHFNDLIKVEPKNVYFSTGLEFWGISGGKYAIIEYGNSSGNFWVDKDLIYNIAGIIGIEGYEVRIYINMWIQKHWKMFNICVKDASLQIELK